MNKKSELRGLTNQEALEKQKIFGLNQIVSQSKPFWIYQLLKIFSDPVVLILLFTSGLSAFLGEYTSSLIIILMVFLSSGLNFSQEYKSSKAVIVLSQKLIRKCLVIRENIKTKILVDQLVPGDVVFLSTGDIVPADGILIESDNLNLNESTLSGESFPMEKKVLTKITEIEVKEEFEESEMLWAGTDVFAGFGYFVVTKTGNNTKLGQIGKSLETSTQKTSFEEEIENFGLFIVRITLSIVAIIFIIILIKSFVENGGFSAKGFLTAFLFSISIVVGLTPEMLPVILSLNMIKGSQAISNKGALVKKLNSIPDFGSMDVLCTDKTGTLTQDKIELVKFLDSEGQTFSKVLDFASLNSFFQSGLKNPLDEAILIVNSEVSQNWQKLKEIPYDFERKRLSVVLENSTEENKKVLISKGQVEEMLKISDFYEQQKTGKIFILNEKTKENFQKIYYNLSQQGFRVLAVGFKNLNKDEIIDKNQEKNLILLGLLAFLDPPKISAKEALQKINQAGINLKIITGDNEIVTKEVCRQLEIKVEGVSVGQEIEKMSEEDLSNLVKTCNIFARCNPTQKLKIIQTLKKSGHTVGYLGDGINDAPSLKSADVGISVDNAVDIARESADIILLKKDLNILVDAVFEGRKTFANTEKYMMMDLSSNFGNMFSMMIASIFLPFLPMLPIQILFNNFLYDISQVTLPLDSVDKEYLEKPKKWKLISIQKFMLTFGLLSSLFDILTFYIMFKILNLDQTSFQTTWFLESLATQILVIFVIRTRLIPFIQSKPSKWLILSAFGAILTAFLVTILPITNFFFGFQNLNQSVLKIILVIVIIYLFLAEITKQFFYKKFKN
jgi:P-type Mg2+ transporter